MKVKNAAFSSFQFLIILLCLSLLVTAAGILLRSYRLFVQKQITTNERRQTVENCITDILQVLSSDNSPESDTQQDLFWKLNETELDGCKVSISSLSSKIDLNFTPANLLIGTGLQDFFISPGAPVKMESKKESTGLFFRYADVSEFLTEEAFNKYFTTYGWANFNVSDDIAIKILLTELINSGSATSFINRRTDFLKTNQLMQSVTEYKLFCGINYENIADYITLSPTMNVNFMDKEILSAILNYSEFNIPNASEKASLIVTAASSNGLNDDSLVNVLGVPKTNKIYYYLGTVTLFWEIKVLYENVGCTLIVGKYPDTDSLTYESKRFLLEKRWE